MTVPFKQLANKVLQFLFIFSASFTIVVKSLWYVQNPSPSTLVLMVNFYWLEWASALLTMGYFSCNLLGISDFSSYQNCSLDLDLHPVGVMQTRFLVAVLFPFLPSLSIDGYRSA